MPAHQLFSAASALLFDFNGTLSDDETLLEEAYALALTELGLPPLKPGEYAGLIGRSEPEIAAALLHSREGSEPQLLLDALSTHYLNLSTLNPRISPTTVDFLHNLHERQVPFGIVTGTLRPLIEPVLRERGIFELLGVLITAEDVSVGKPAPEGFLHAAGALGTDPAQCLVFEDSAAGIAAARAAGMPIIGIGAGLDYPTMEAAAKALNQSLNQSLNQTSPL